MPVESILSPASSAVELARLCAPVFGRAPVSMIAVNGASHIVQYANPAFCRLMRKPVEEFIGKSFGDLLPEHDECVPSLDRVFQTGNPEIHNGQSRSKSDSVFWSYSMWPLLAQERLVGIIIQVTETSESHETTVEMNEALVLGAVRQHELTEAADRANTHLLSEIGERKHAEQELRLAQVQLLDRAGQLEGLVRDRTTELVATNSQMEAFVYSIAHDLRAPLRAMLGFSTILIEEAGEALNKTNRDYCDRIRKSARFMDAMVSDLLAFSQVSQQKVELASVGLGPVVAIVLAHLQKDIQEKNASVLSGGSWPAVMAHEPTLTQALFNLTGNALKFIRPGVPSVIRLRTEDLGENVRVWVEDNGLGIPPEGLNRVFDLFSRLNGEKFPGTGIGLAIVQKGIERMGGHVGVTSIPGEGSRFWFELRKA